MAASSYKLSATSFSLMSLVMSSASGPLPPAATMSSRVMLTILTPGAAAARAALNSSASPAGTVPPTITALGTFRALASAPALVPSPELGAMSVLPEARGTSSERAVARSKLAWTTAVARR